MVKKSYSKKRAKLRGGRSLYMNRSRVNKIKTQQHSTKSRGQYNKARNHIMIGGFSDFMQFNNVMDKDAFMMMNSARVNGYNKNKSLKKELHY